MLGKYLTRCELLCLHQTALHDCTKYWFLKTVATIAIKYVWQGDFFTMISFDGCHQRVCFTVKLTTALLAQVISDIYIHIHENMQIMEEVWHNNGTGRATLVHGWIICNWVMIFDTNHLFPGLFHNHQWKCNFPVVVNHINVLLHLKLPFQNRFGPSRLTKVETVKKICQLLNMEYSLLILWQMIN